MRYSFYCNSSDGKDLKRSAALTRYRKRAVSVSCLSDALFVPYLGLFHNGKFIKQSHWGGVPPDNCLESRGQGRIDEAFYIGVIHPCWGHSIVDGTRHLWPLAHYEWRQRFSDVKFVYSMAYQGAALPKNFLELLELLGVSRDRLMEVRDCTQVGKLYLADEACWYDIETPEKRFFTDEYRDLMAYICKCTAGVGNVKLWRKIYLSRSGWKQGRRRVDFGENLVESAFKSKFCVECIRPETLSFVQLVEVLQQTHTLVATEGSISHNALFLPAGANIVIVRKAGFVSYYQLLVNEIKDLNVTYVDANRTRHFYSAKEPYFGPFFMYVNKCLSDFLSVRSRFPVFVYFQYRLAVFSSRIRVCMGAMKARALRLLRRRA